MDIIEEINEDTLYLRKVSKHDQKFFFESLKNESMIKYLSLGPLNDLDHAKRLIHNYLSFWDKYIQFNYLVEFREANSITKIGSVSLWNVSWIHKRAEIGIWLLPKYWNQGIGKHVVSLIKNVGFIHLKLHRIEAHVCIENIRSIHLFNACGFTQEATLNDYLNMNDKFYNAIVFASINNIK